MGHLDRTGGYRSYLKMDMTIWMSLILGVISLATPALSSEPRVVCYYTNWSVYRPGTARFNPQNINPYLCTHLIYAFGGFTKDNTLKPFDKYQDIEKGGYAKFTGLKTYNKNLKTLLAIGGWNEGSSRFSPMVASRERRKEFVRNVIKFLRQNRFDGLDLDWEYPAYRDGGKPKDRENYAKLVRELREEFDREAEKTGKPRLLLTMAVPAGIEYIQKGFDVKTLNRYLDWMNLLTYDYHSAFEPAVNHHAPLYPLEEPNEYSVDTELNIDYTIKFYLENGADADKLVLGIPTYGRSYTLFNADAVEIGSPADGPGEQGDATREKGYLAYYEICEALKPKPNKKRSASDEDSEEYEEEEEEWTVMHPNADAMGPVAYKGNQWVGYDDIDIVKKKGEYVAENGLGGIMFWSIDNDDFRGNCHEKPYPLIEAAKEAYIAKFGSSDKAVVTSKPVSRPTSGSNRRRNRPKSSTTTTEKPTTAKSNKRKSSVSSTTPTWNVTPEPPTTPDPGSDFKCVDEGFFQHPRDCKKYFWCLDSGPSNLGIVAHQFTCPSGLFFNKAADSCDFARNVLCKLPAATTKASTTKAPTTKPATTVTTTTRKPVRLSTKNSVLFRTSTTTTAPELESEEYEEDITDDINDEDAEDPRVIKELIDLIKKVGGVEQLEKQLHLAESSASTDGASTTTPTPFNKKLYQKVLERARGKNKYTKNSIQRDAQNSRRGPQTQGLEATDDKDRFLKKDRPQYTTINRQRAVVTPEPQESEEEETQSEEVVQPSRARAVESQSSPARETQRVGTTSKPLQYVNIRRARPTTSDTADDTASRNALFERTETFVTVSEPNALNIQSSRKENGPEYVTIRRQRPTTEETTTIQYQEPELEQETALEREISSQPQYTSIVRARGTTVSVSEEPSSSESPSNRPRYTTIAPEDISSPEPTTVLAVQISSLLNSPSSEEEDIVVQTTEAEATTTSTTSRPTTTTTTTTTAASPSTTTRRNILRRRGSTTTTTSTPTPSTSTTQTAKRTFLRRTKPTSPPETEDSPTTLPTIDNETKFPKRGVSKFKPKESARNETSAATKRPSLVARRGERPPTRNFVRRRPAGANVTTTTAAPVASSSSASIASTTRRPFRIASRRRPAVSTTTSTTTSTQATTLALDSEESLQDIGDIDAIEDPSLEPRAPKRTTKTPRRPLVNLKEDLKDQNPSATNDDERKRQSKKYSSSFKQNQLDDLLKARSGEVTTEIGTTLEEYNAETALALATHQLITAPLPTILDYEEGTKPTRAKTTLNKDTTEYTNTPTYDEYSTATYKTNPTSQGFIQTTLGDAFSIYDTPRITTTYEEAKTTDFTASRRPYTEPYEPKTNYEITKTTEDATTDSKQPSQDIDAGKTTFVTNTLPTTTGRHAGYTNLPNYERISTTFEVPKQTVTLNRYPTTPIYQTVTNQYVPTTRDYVDTPERSSSFSTPTPFKPRGFSSPNIITPGYSGLQRGGTKYLNPSEKPIPVTETGYSTSGFRSSSQDPTYFTREYLLESPVTKTYDEEYQYLSPTTPQSTTRKVYRKKIQRRISTTLRPTTPTYVPEVTSPKPSRVPSRQPFEKVPKKEVEAGRTYRPVVNYDYYDDSAERVALKYAEGTKVVLHGKGSIECLDVGNFPHPTSCKKFISCARMEFGAFLGWEYVCPKGLSFDPVGGICNWSAGLGCDENDV